MMMVKAFTLWVIFMRTSYIVHILHIFTSVALCIEKGKRAVFRLLF